MKAAYLGIDPGSSSGCIGIIFREHGTFAETKATMEFSKYTTKEWFEELKDLTTTYPCFAVLEKVHGMPGMNVVAISSFMKNVGHIEMALLALDIPFIEVTPQSWMKYYGLKKEKDESKPDWKRRLREHLQRIMPDFKVTNDTADAMLLAYYAMKHDQE
jgi:Holliday junction resolvasome RuvABC endonuclease subunit